MATKTKAIAKKQASDVPAYLQDTDDLGTDDIGSEDIVIPRLKVCQAQSRVHEVNNKIKDGQVYNSVSNEALPDPVEVFIVYHWKSDVWFSDDFKLLCTCFRDPDTKEQVWFGQDVEVCKKRPDDAKNCHNYMVITAQDLKSCVKNKEYPMPLILSCMSAAVTSARKLNSKIKMNAGKRMPIYAQPVEITSSLQKFTKGNAYIPEFSFVNKYATKDEFEFLKEYHKMCKVLHKRSDVHISQENEEGVQAQSPNKKVNDDNVPF